MEKINNNSDFLNIIDYHLIHTELDANILEKEFKQYIMGFKEILHNVASTGAYDLVQQLKDDLITIKSKRIKCCTCNTDEDCENKALILRYIEKAICYIESEYQLYVLGKIFPDFATIKHGDLSNSGLYFNGSQSDIVELSEALYLSKTVLQKSGKPATFKEILSILEKIFNLKVKNEYIVESKLFNRKKNFKPFIDLLATSLETERKKRLF